MSNSRTTYIFPLGEIVTPNIGRTLGAFIGILHEKDASIENAFYQAALTTIALVIGLSL